LKSRTSAPESVSMVLPGDLSDWCRRFKGPAISWIEICQGRPPRYRNVPFASPQTNPTAAFASCC
jgi:hypothetical protein